MQKVETAFAAITLVAASSSGLLDHLHLGAFVDSRTIVPAVLGSGLSTYQRWRQKKLKFTDLIGSFFTAIVAAQFIGPYLDATVLPGDGLVLAVFIIALVGSNLVEAIVDGDVGRFVDALFSRLSGKK